MLRLPSLTALSLSAALLPTLASAEIATGIPGLSLSGDVNFQHYDDGRDGQSLINTDLALAWRPTTDSELDLGLELSIISNTWVDHHWTDYTLWGGVVLGFDGVDVRLGSPRPVTKTMELLPALGNNADEEFWSNILLGSRTLEYSTYSDQMFTPGVSVQSTGDGPFQWGVSLHQMIEHDPDPDDYQYYRDTVLEAVGQYNFGNLTVAGQLVVTNYDGDYYDWEDDEIYDENETNRSAMVSARYAKDNWVLGVNVGRHNSWWEPMNFVRLHGAYTFGNGLTVTADLLRQKDTEDDEYWTSTFLGVDYEMSGGYYVKAGTSHWEDGSHSESLTLGFKF